MSNNKVLIGVYFLYKKKKLRYIGKSTDLEHRINLHKAKGKVRFDYCSFIILDIDKIYDAEIEYIKQFNPPVNVAHTERIYKSHKKARKQIKRLRNLRLSELLKNA